MPNDNKIAPTTNKQPPTSDGAPPIFVQEDVLPPMMNNETPPTVDVVNSSPATATVGSAAPTDDVVSTVMPAVTTSVTPKKKFAGGKIIATILGLFLLIGGVGAGVYLTGQNQNIAEKAGEECVCASGNPNNCPDNYDCFGGTQKACDGTICAPHYDCVNNECVYSQTDNPPGDETSPPATIPPATTPPAVIPVCQSATISKNTLTGPGDSLTIYSTATTNDITGFSYGFYNLDNLYGPDNPKPIFFTANTHYVRGDTVTPTSRHSITVTYDELNKNDLNWGSGQQKPTKIQVNAFFGNSAGWNSGDVNCKVQFNITVTGTATLSCNSNCDLYNGPADQCGQGRSCLNVGTGAPQAKCRNPQCSSSTTCTCPTTPPSTVSCTSLTSNVANPVVGQSITGTCRGTYTSYSTKTTPVARFRVSLNGTWLGTSEAIPLNSAMAASYTTSVPTAGNYVVQCQICTDNTASNCTAWGQAN